MISKIFFIPMFTLSSIHKSYVLKPLFTEHDMLCLFLMCHLSVFNMDVRIYHVTEWCVIQPLFCALNVFCFFDSTLDVFCLFCLTLHVFFLPQFLFVSEFVLMEYGCQNAYQWITDGKPFLEKEQGQCILNNFTRAYLKRILWAYMRAPLYIYKILYEQPSCALNKALHWTTIP